MKSIQVLSKCNYFLKHYGPIYLFKKIFTYPIEKIRNRKLLNLLKKTNNSQEYFTFVYFDSINRNLESLSGVGSTLVQTQDLREELPKLISKFNIESILDAPCGDLNWMKFVLKNFNGTYTGVDIVQPLISNLNQTYSSDRVNFIHADITNFSFPNVDLMICRDFLFHLSVDDINKLFSNFKNSSIKYLLTTTHKNTNNSFQNSNIKTGEFRHIDLFLPPFNFPRDYLYSIEDWIYPEPERLMCLWEWNQVPEKTKWL